jgi:hypothetical protein
MVLWYVTTGSAWMYFEELSSFDKKKSIASGHCIVGTKLLTFSAPRHKVDVASFCVEEYIILALISFVCPL